MSLPAPTPAPPAPTPTTGLSASPAGKAPTWLIVSVLAVFVIFVFYMFYNNSDHKPSLSEVDKNNTQTADQNDNQGTTKTTETKPQFVDSVFTVYLKSTDSLKLKNYKGYLLNISTGGTTKNPVPYFQKNGDKWEKLGITDSEVKIKPDFYAWLKGDSTKRTKIWYFWSKI